MNPGSRGRLRRLLAGTLAGGLLLGGAVAGAPLAAAAPGEIIGSTDPANATALPLGDSRSSLGNGFDQVDRNRYYRLQRSQPDSTIHLGAVMLPPGQGRDGFSIDTSLGQGRDCFSGSEFTPTRGGGVVAVSGDALDGCGPEPSVQARVQRVNLPEMTRAAEPAQTLLRVIEVPRARNYDQLPGPAPRPNPDELPTDNQAQVTAGTLIDPAPLESERSYRLRLTSGQLQVFATDLDWGQWLQVQARIAPSTETARVADAAPQFGITALGPDLGTVAETSASLTGDADQADLVTDPVALRAYRGRGGTPFLAGRHLIAVWLSPDALPGPLTVDYTLTTRVGGAVSGVPDFGGDQIRGAGSGRPAWRMPAAIGVGAVGVGLLVAAGAVWWVSRRRTGAAP
ncbi:hypothetical protein [Enemella evansiae]|uniref:hypothetical protein n=1 Tax=Enemella evansiae TaxID=2016499 RepID=UPI001595888F|nr:hypothetical protein [Enemella evansiae]